MSDRESKGGPEGGPELDRRQLIGGLGGAALVAGLGIDSVAAQSEPSTPAAVAPAAPAATASFELAELSIAELGAGLAQGRWTTKRLVELYLERIETIDRGPRGTNAVAEPNPDAFREAERLDRERLNRRLKGPLHGIPIVLKDNIETGDGMKTTAGSLALAESRAERDAFLVERLRAAGALVLAKTNLSEWANFRSTKLDLGLERPRRTGAQPVRPRPQPVRLLVGLGRRGLGESLRRRRSAPRPTARSSVRRR